MTTTRARLAALALCASASAAAPAATTMLDVDFEDDALGPLGPPWVVFPGNGASSVSIVDVPGRHGHVLQLDADPSEGEFLTASDAFSASQRRIVSRVDIRPQAGAAFIWSLTGAGASLGARRIRLQLAPGSDVLDAQTSPSGETACGRLPQGKWSRVTLSVDARFEPHTFDVLIDGQPTACTGIVTGLGPPFDGVTVMDASNAGWGGRTQFDNILVKAR